MTDWAAWDTGADIERSSRGADWFCLEFRLQPDRSPYGWAEWCDTQRTLVLRCEAASHVERDVDHRTAVSLAVSYFGSCIVEICSGEIGLQHYYDRLVSWLDDQPD